MSIENRDNKPPYERRLFLPDGTPWIGDESSGWPEGEQSSSSSPDPLTPEKTDPDERSYPGVFGMGKEPQDRKSEFLRGTL